MREVNRKDGIAINRDEKRGRFVGREGDQVMMRSV